MAFYQQPTKGFVAFIAGAMAVTSLVLTGVTWTRMEASIQASQNTLLLKTAWEEMFSTLKDAETGQRGFQITGEESFLEPFHRATTLLPEDLGSLEDLDQHRLVSEEESASIRRLVDEKLTELRDAITIHKREGSDAARAFILAGEGKRTMDGLRQRIGAVISRLEQEVARRQQIMRRDQKWGFASALGSGVVALGAGVFSLMLVRETLTQLRREERLAAGKARAEQSEREKSIFLATMSHEIRTPMNAILGFGELLSQEALTENGRRHAATILQSGRALLQLINDILDLSKIEAGMLQITAEPCDVNEVSGFVQQMFSRQAAEKGLHLRVETASMMPRSLLIDSVRLRQILVNVVGNSLKFTEKGHITIRLGGERLEESRSRMLLVVEVEDTGIGIPREMQADVFKPFVQVAGRERPGARGTGLGLTIVKRLADLMGARVILRSEPGRGTTFVFEFPQVEVSARLPENPLPPQQKVDFNKLRPARILVVDDNPMNLNLLSDIFASTHHKVLLAGDGREAVDKALAEKPDVVLMDIRMPEMDGCEAQRLLRKQPSLQMLPVIAVTASSLLHEEAALRRTFDGYVRKPFSLADLYRELALFIPLQPPDRPAIVPAKPLSPEAAARWLALAADLHTLQRDVWPGVREGMTMSEVSAFAARLAGLGAAAACPPVEGYGRTLAAASSAFALASMENALAEFPQLISLVEAAASAPSPPP